MFKLPPKRPQMPLLTTKDRENLTESIRNLKNDPDISNKKLNLYENDNSNSNFGCISIKD